MNVYKNKQVKNLVGAFASLKDENEIRAFLRDLMTEQEIETFAARFAVAQMLDKSLPYREISDITGMSTATITRINNWLERGAGGYRTVINRIHHHNSKAAEL